MKKLKYEIRIDRKITRYKQKEITRADICESCFVKFINQINSDVEIDKLGLKKLSSGDNYIPSNVDNIKKVPEKTWYHDNVSFSPNGMICKNCDEELKA